MTTPAPYFTKRSRARLDGVHADLCKLMLDARGACYDRVGYVFEITEGRRTAERQKQLYDIGATMTRNSRHLTGHAVDVVCMVDGRVRWDWPLYEQLAEAVPDGLAKLDGILHTSTVLAFRRFSSQDLDAAWDIGVS